MAIAKYIKKLMAAILLLTMGISLQAQDKRAYQKETFVEHQDTLLYRILWPKKFKKKKKYPLVLFLHGAGERGKDNEKQLVHGSDLFVEHQKEFPAIVIFPQCPKDDYWSNVNITKDESGHRTFSFIAGGQPTEAMQQVLNMIDSVTQLSFVDKHRVYVVGLSMGGMGTFEIINRRPDMFAAAMPICGGANTATAQNFAGKINLWVFHGAKDDIVPPMHSEHMVKAIKEAGGNVKFTLFPNANHNSWDSAFAEPEFLSWLFSNSK